MVIGVTFVVLSVLVAVIWVTIEMKRLKHKLFAIFLISLILFGYISFTFVLKGQDLDLKSVSGMVTAGKIYTSWLGSVFSNMKSITAYAVKKDWAVNESVNAEIKKSDTDKSDFVK